MLCDGEDSLYIFFGVEIGVFHAPIGYQSDILLLNPLYMILRLLEG